MNTLSQLQLKRLLEPHNASLVRVDIVIDMSFVQKLFRTKSSRLLIEEAGHPDHQMKKTLGAFDLVAFGVGATIGSGIFSLAGTACAGSPAQAAGHERS